MRRSFIRLVVLSVLASWAIGFAVLLVYSQARTWTPERARADGVFLFYELLGRDPRAGPSSSVGGA